jgi:hypothetical protein
MFEIDVLLVKIEHVTDIVVGEPFVLEVALIFLSRF